MYKILVLSTLIASGFSSAFGSGFQGNPVMTNTEKVVIKSKTGTVIGYFMKTSGPKFTENLATFLPPATAKIDSLLQEATILSKQGVSSLVLLPPYTRHEFDSFSRGPENPEGEVQFWDLNATEICETVETLRKDYDLHGASVLLGKNLGGSFGAYTATRCRVDSLLAFGSVPSLSRFWANSNHPKARAFREGREGLMQKFSEVTRMLDLDFSLERSKIRTLLQFGATDDWIDQEQKELITVLPRKIAVKWYSADHEMETPEVRRDRTDYAASR